MPKSDKLLRHAIIITLPQVFHLFFKLIMVNVLPAGYSQLEAFIALLAIVATPLGFLTAWMSYRTSRLVVAGDAGSIGEFALSSIRTFALFGLGAGLVVLALGLVLRDPSGNGRVLTEIFAGCVVFVVLSPVLNGLLQGRQRYGWMALYVLAFAVVKMTLGAAFAAAGLGVNGGALGILGAYCVGVPIAALAAIRAPRGVSVPVTPASAPPAIGYLALSAAALSAMSIFFFSDVVILRYLNAPRVDDFAASRIIGNIFIYAPLPLIAAMFPKVTERYCSGRNPLPLLWKAFGVALAACAVGLAAWWFLAPVVGHRFLGGRYYGEVGHISRIYCLAMTPYALANVLVQFSVACGRWRFLAVLLPAALVHVILVYFLGSNVWNVIAAVGVLGCVVTALVLALVITDKKFARR